MASSGRRGGMDADKAEALCLVGGACVAVNAVNLFDCDAACLLAILFVALMPVYMLARAMASGK